ncbi:MAG: glycerol-3-phosphate dehydrogenase [Granulosicoccus sp.]
MPTLDNQTVKEGQHFDLCVVGGGINGVGIARDAAGRGLSVLLVEKGDLAEGTSSRSGKLVHGGLRYLEYYEFRLVRDALIEREVLLESAPHIIWPMRFVLPHSPNDRPAWLIRLGLFLYDHLGGRKKLPGTRVLNLHSDAEGIPIKKQYKRGFEYSDCWVDDARLVVLNALDAVEKGACVLTQTSCSSARREKGQWFVTLESGHNRQPLTISAGGLVNAAGPWVDSVIKQIDEVDAKRRVRLVKGSHIIVKKFWDGDHAYLVQNDDKRVIFINPYEQDQALIGTTDIPFDGDPADVEIDPSEVDYLVAAVNKYFEVQLTAADVVHQFSGVRPLFDDNAANPSAVTRDYLFDLNAIELSSPLLSVYGGKITTYRKLAEQAVDKLSPYYSMTNNAWTATAPLPGGDMPDADFEQFIESLEISFRALPKALLYHYGRLYGTRTYNLLDGVESTTQLGKHFGHLLYEVEVSYLVNHEWARNSTDILQRRTKHGLHLSNQQKLEFEEWFAEHRLQLLSSESEA